MVAIDCRVLLCLLLEEAMMEILKTLSLDIYSVQQNISKTMM